MEFFVITGPHAVGKMTVGFKLAEKLDLKLFHNHMTIEPILRIFNWNTKEAQSLIYKFRQEIFEAMANSQENGMVFTYMWAFDMESEYVYINNLMNLFESKGANTYIVELEADVNVRIERNKTQFRLEEKPTKRNIEWSQNDLINGMKKYRLNSLPGEVKHKNYLKINNSDLDPDTVADQIIEYFKLQNVVE